LEASTSTKKDLKAPKVSLSRAKGATIVLQLEAYIEPLGSTGKWTGEDFLNDAARVQAAEVGIHAEIGRSSNVIC
jgi:hypothetical protein